MHPSSFNIRTTLGLGVAVVLFFLIRFVDEFLVNRPITGYDMTGFIGSHQRPILAYFASITVGAFIAQRGLLWPVVSLVTVITIFTLASTYAHRDDYVATLRVIDLDWPGAVMAIVTAVVAVKAGEMIARLARQFGKPGA